MKKRKVVMALSLLVVLALTACGKDDPPVETPPDISEQPPVVTQTSQGDVFLSSNLKIKSVIVDKSVTPERQITIELYVDKNGNGQGLIGFSDMLCDVIVSSDILYVKLDEGLLVAVSDLTGRLISASTDVAGKDDLGVLGFTAVDGVPTEYNVMQGDLTIYTRFAQSTNTFTKQNVVSESVMPLSSLASYIIDYNKEQTVEVQGTEEAPEVVDFYLNSDYGVTIDGKLYSVGDTCNPRSYFAGLTPEGLLTSSAYKEDGRVDFLHVSYVSATGRSVFITTSNYVQSISTNAEFSFMGIEKGMDSKTLKHLLGYKLTIKDLENWQPIDENLVCTNYKSNVYYCTLGGLSIEFRVGAGSLLEEIYVEQTLDFKR